MPELQNIEWKSIWKDDYLAWICGFANAQGGTLYIGKNDEGEVVGVANSRKLLEDLPNKIRDALGIIVPINLLEENELEYLEIPVQPYPIAISYRGTYYYRSGSTNQKLTGLELESFLLRKQGATWDNLPLPSFTIEDVDDGVVKRFKKWASKKGRIDKSALDEPKDILMKKLHLMSNGYLTNAAMLLFAEDPESWQLGAFTKIGYFESDSDLRYQDEIHGSLLDQIDRIIEIVHLKYMKAKITYEGVQRIERYFVPDEALREALLNALCHKDYARGIPIQVSVYDDRLYIANCGRLPENWSTEKLMEKHSSEPFNPNIAHVFYLAGFIESWGRGIEKICDSCKADNVPLPEYDITGNSVMIKFIAPEDRIIRIGSERVTEKVTERVTEKELEVLSLLRENPSYTYNELADKLHVSRKTVSGRIASLRNKGIILRAGSDTKGYWQINE
jgi:ATP-dependent DNA helicase RecG